MLYRWLIATVSVLFVLFGEVHAFAAAGVQTNMVLRNAADVLALPDDQASVGIPVSIQGVVTVAETNWSGRFFVQDNSGGVFVENRTRQPAVGDLVEISGITRAGGYAPCITKPIWKKLGTAPLPEAKPVTIEELMSGVEDSQRVAISGVVRDAQLVGNDLEIELASGGYRFHAYLALPKGIALQSLIGAKVLLKGTAATAYNAPAHTALRHFVTVTLYVTQPDDFIVEEAASVNPYDQPLAPLNAIAQYRRDRLANGQVHVKGVVTYQRIGQDLFLQDATGGLQVKSKLAVPVLPGDVVEAVGFPAVDNYLPVLEDAVFRKTSEPRTKLMPREVMVPDLMKGLHHADYVNVKGVLVDRMAQGIGRTANKPVIQTTLVLQNSSNLLFAAEKDTTEPKDFLTSIPIGSEVEVKGICMLESDEDGKIKSLHILLPASHSVSILKKPSWLTTRHLLASMGILSGVLLLAISWSVMVSKKNSKLESLVVEKESAQNELQQAHDLLEWRVTERTKQLKVEMTARKETELQFRAVLTERTRLAQELHDTLEQTITGIALQLDRVANHFAKNPDNASHHLKLARNLTRQGQTDVRRSVWGLRSRAGEKFDLVNALNITSQQIAHDAGIQVQINTEGEVRPLPETFEENLLRIAQEAITNAVKHSGANTVKVEFQFSPEKVVLQIKDDGKGFNPEKCDGPNEGHFGLLGIRERAERMNGAANISSTPGAGACVRVEVPISQNSGNGQGRQEEAEKYEERV
ncbi:MAG TPA: histidine kinase [Pseudomonadales bacterium]|nr:histidine kinase [Pseudomonadales bacterium]